MDGTEGTGDQSGAGSVAGGNFGGASGDGGTGAGGAAGGSGGTGSGSAPAWYDSAVQDAEARAWVQKKGWSDLDSAIQSHRQLEKMVGVDMNTVVRLPKPGDTEAQRAMYAKLGMPGEASQYDLGEMPEGLPVDEQYQGFAKEMFHKAGLSKEQAKTISAEHNAYVAAQIERQAKDYQLSVADGESQLQAEWRGGYDRMINQASQTAKMLGFSAEMIDGLENKVGYANTLKFLANLGSKLGEDSFVSAEGNSRKFAGLLTPEEAKAEWDSLTLDPNFTKALFDKDHAGHKTAAENQKRLFSVMYPGG